MFSDNIQKVLWTFHRLFHNTKYFLPFRCHVTTHLRFNISRQHENYAMCTATVQIFIRSILVPRPQANIINLWLNMAHVAVLHCLLEDSNLLGYERELLEQGKCQSESD